MITSQNSKLFSKGFVFAVFAAVVAAALPMSMTSAATDGQLSVLINGQPPGEYCIAGPITVSGSGVTGGQGSTWHLVIGWGDGTASTTSDGTPSLITSGSVNKKNSAFTYSASHDFVAGSTSGLTVILYHVQPSGQDGQVIVVNQCVAAPTEGVVVLAKHVVNDNVAQKGTAVAADFTLSIDGQEFEGSETGAAPGALVEAGTYSINETGPEGYDRTGTVCVDTDTDAVVSTDGTITVVAGHNYLCTITNNDSAPVYGTLEIVKNVTGGIKLPGAFTLRVFNDADLEVVTAFGSAEGTLHDLLVGNYTITEDQDPHYDGVFSGACASGEITLTEAGAVCTVTNTFKNTVPTAAPDVYSVDEDTVLNQGAPGVLDNDTDPEGDEMLAGLIDTTDHGILVLDSDGSFTYTPNANYVGADSFTYQASDPWGASETVTVSITVNPINDAPIALDDTDNGTEDASVTVSVLANDSDVDGDTLVVSAVDAVSAQGGTIVDNLDGTVTYTPALDFNGEDTFSYTVSDGNGGTDTATVTIVVGGENDIPEATADEYGMDEDESLVINAPGVLGNDDDADGDELAAELVDGPAHGTLELNSDGSFTYTPDADFNGTDSFTYCADDGEVCSNTVTVTITVDPVNDAPVAEDSAHGTAQNLPVVDMLDASDVDGDDLSFEITVNPVSGTFSFFDADTGAFTYQPNNNFVGVDFFKFMANDGEVDSNEATVTITVTESPENDLPLCSDGKDNDNDDLVDLADPDCEDFIPHLTLVKVVEGGDASAESWTLSATADGDQEPTLSGAGSAADDVAPGTYTLTESGEVERYAASLWSCVKNDSEVAVEANTVTLAIGDEVICTITNTFSPYTSDVSVVKSVSNTAPTNGQSVTYTIVASNAGPDDAANVVVTDLLPAGVSYVSDDSEGAYATSTGQWEVGDLKNGESKTLNIVVTVTTGTGEVVTNTASVTNDHADNDSEDNTSSATFTTPEDENRGGGGGFRTPRGEVLGAVLGESCGLYMDQYLKRNNPKNNPAQVTKLQEFLIKYNYGAFTPTGFFGPLTEAAVKAFQTKYAAEVLTPWGINAPTGLAYLTTIRQINLIECPELMLEMPVLVDWNKNPAVQ